MPASFQVQWGPLSQEDKTENDRVWNPASSSSLWVSMVWCTHTNMCTYAIHIYNTHSHTKEWALDIRTVRDNDARKQIQENNPSREAGGSRRGDVMETKESGVSKREGSTVSNAAENNRKTTWKILTMHTLKMQLMGYRFQEFFLM